MGREPKPTDAVFPNQLGIAYHPNSALFLRKDMKKANLPIHFVGVAGDTFSFDFHSLRRSFASLLELECGVERQRIGALLGHKATSVAAQSYLIKNRPQCIQAIQSLPLTFRKQGCRMSHEKKPTSNGTSVPATATAERTANPIRVPVPNAARGRSVSFSCLPATFAAEKSNPTRLSAVIAKSLISWQDYIVRSELGSPLRHATIEQFQHHLDHYLMSLQMGSYVERTVPRMATVDWAQLVREERFIKNGKFDVKLAVDWFKHELTERLDAILAAEQARKQRAENRVAAIHKAFDDLEESIIPYPNLLMTAMITLDLPAKEVRGEEHQINLYLAEPSNLDFATYSAGPKSGVLRVTD